MTNTKIELGDIIDSNCRRTWKEICELILEMMDSAEKTKDSGLYMASLRLTKLFAELANTKIDLSKIVEIKEVYR